MNLVEVQNLSKVFGSPQGDVHAFDDLNFTIGQGKVVSAVGPSGGGKSTLLKVVAGLLSPSHRHVHYDGEPVTEPPRDIGVMLQTAVLFSLAQCVAERAASRGGVRQVTLRARGRGVRGHAGGRTGGLREELPVAVVGGMQPRVVLARTLLYKPRLLRMDEPFGALDEFTRENMNDRWLELWTGHGNTGIFITHNIQEALHGAAPRHAPEGRGDRHGRSVGRVRRWPRPFVPPQHRGFRGSCNLLWSQRGRQGASVVAFLP